MGDCVQGAVEGGRIGISHISWDGDPGELHRHAALSGAHPCGGWRPHPSAQAAGCRYQQRCWKKVRGSFLEPMCLLLWIFKYVNQSECDQHCIDFKLELSSLDQHLGNLRSVINFIWSAFTYLLEERINR